MTILITILTITGILLQVPDVLTTNKVISQGGREANPIIRWYMSHAGKWWWTSKLLAAGLIASLWFMQGRGDDALILTVLAVINIIYIAAVISNYRLIK